MTAIIEARDLVKTVNGFAAVDSISFTVAEGAILDFLRFSGEALFSRLPGFRTGLDL
jgi:ABC-type multidrug transport system ATPase subunit